MSKHQCSPENAGKMKDWIANRGGLFIWQSINLSNPSASWTTPARTEDGQPYQKPTWQAAAAPARHITSADDVEVVTANEVKRFHVGVRQAGLSIKVTDGGSRRIRAAVEKAGEGAWYEFDYSTQEAIILVPGKVVPLNEWSPA